MQSPTPRRRDAAAADRTLRLRRAVLGVHGVHAFGLIQRKTDHAEVVDIIHEVVDRIVARLARPLAAVAPHRASVGRAALERRVVHGIPGTTASALEGVIKPEPVTHLMRAGVALALPFVTEVWQVYVLIFALQSASAAFTPTFQATIPDVLPEEARYTRALSLSRLAYDLENIVSPTLAALLLAVDRPLDMLRTVVNVWSDSCGAAVIARSEGEQTLIAIDSPGRKG